MNPKLWWYLARATGMVAWSSLAASVVWGVLLSSGILGGRLRPARLNAMHRWLSGIAVGMTAAHLAALLADSYVQFNVIDLFVPYASSWKPGPVALGAVAFDLLLVVMITSVAMRRLPRRAWKLVHLSSYGCFWLAGLHGISAGTDAANLPVRATFVAGIAVVAFLTSYRALAGRRRRVRFATGSLVLARGNDDRPAVARH